MMLSNAEKPETTSTVLRATPALSASLAAAALAVCAVLAAGNTHRSGWEARLLSSAPPPSFTLPRCINRRFRVVVDSLLLDNFLAGTSSPAAALGADAFASPPRLKRLLPLLLPSCLPFTLLLFFCACWLLLAIPAHDGHCSRKNCSTITILTACVVRVLPAEPGYHVRNPL